MLFGKAGGAFQELIVVGKETVLVGRGPGGFHIAQVIDDRVELDDNLVTLGLQGGDVGGHLVPVGLADCWLVAVEVPKVGQQGDGDGIEAEGLSFFDDLIGIHSAGWGDTPGLEKSVGLLRHGVIDRRRRRLDQVDHWQVKSSR